MPPRGEGSAWASLACRTAAYQFFIVDDFGTDETARQVGVDLAGGLDGGRSAGQRPAAGPLGTGGGKGHLAPRSPRAGGGPPRSGRGLFRPASSFSLRPVTSARSAKVSSPSSRWISSAGSLPKY